MSVLVHDAFFDHVLEFFWSEKYAVLLKLNEMKELIDMKKFHYSQSLISIRTMCDFINGYGILA